MARYTLSMPDSIMTELKVQAKEHDCNIKDIVRQCLKFGLMAIEISESKEKKILVENSAGEIKELYVIF